MTNVIVSWNRVLNLGRQGIQVHKFAADTTPNQPNLVNIEVSNNSVANVGRHFGWGANDIERYVSLQKNQNVVSDHNRIAVQRGDWTIGTFLRTPTTCNLNGASSCTISWSVTNLPAGSSPVVKVNGRLFSAGPTNVDKGASWTRTQSASWIGANTYYEFKLFLDESDTDPAAVLVVEGV